VNPLDDFRDAFRLFELRSVLDIALIAALIYAVLLLLRNTTAMQVLRGIGLVLIAVFVLARALDLIVLNWIISHSFTGLLIALPIIFQPEIRRTLERVGRTGFRAWFAGPSYESIVDPLADACLSIAAQRHGALIVLERDTGLRDYIETGVQLDAAFSPELLEGLFYTNSPLHDGAAVLREDRVIAAGCTLPLSDHIVPRHTGTRHRAALGVSERTDAVAIVVSEENAGISVASDGRIVTDVDETRFRALLHTLVGTPPGAGGGRGDRSPLRAWTNGRRRSAAS
jgi:diadenylate cyclase